MIRNLLVASLAAVFSFQFTTVQAEETLGPHHLEMIEKLKAKSLKSDLGYEIVEDLTTRVGPRLAGSEAEARARDWAVEMFKTYGFDNIRVEEFEIDYWARTLEEARVIGASAQELHISALGGSPSTPETGITAALKSYPSIAALRRAPEGDAAGMIVFLDEEMTRTMDGSGYGYAVRKRRACAEEAKKKGALACLIRSVGTDSHRFPHTGMMQRGEALGALPSAALSNPDADQLRRLLAIGETEIFLNIQTEVTENVVSGNVIGEIVGRESPDEIVLIGAHLDSWDLGTGAVDDGAGVGITVAAAKHIMKAMPKGPKRTIRVVLFGAEEVGLLGARAYTEKHAEDVPNHMFAAESDFGADVIWQLQTRFGEGALDYARIMQEAVADLGVNPANNMARGGPDLAFLAPRGVPVVTPRQNGLDYFDLHHTADDTLDKIDPLKVRQNVAVYSVLTYLAAEMDWDFRKAKAED